MIPNIGIMNAIMRSGANRTSAITITNTRIHGLRFALGVDMATTHQASYFTASPPPHFCARRPLTAPERSAQSTLVHGERALLSRYRKRRFKPLERRRSLRFMLSVRPRPQEDVPALPEVRVLPRILSRHGSEYYAYPNYSLGRLVLVVLVDIAALSDPTDRSPGDARAVRDRTL